MTAAKRVYIDAEGEDALEKSYRYCQGRVEKATPEPGKKGQ